MTVTVPITSPVPVERWPSGNRPPAPAGVGSGSQISAAALHAHREAGLHRVVARLAGAGKTVRVGCYSLVTPGQGPTARLAETLAVVQRRGWTATLTVSDDTGVSDPALRPQMARLVTALCAGKIHGIVAVSQVDISPFGDIYAHTLATLDARGGFLALARSETSI